MISDKNCRITVNLNNSLRKKLDEVCDKTGASLSSLVTKVLSNYFSDDVMFVEMLPSRELEKKQIRISLTLSEISALEIHAENHGFSISEEIVFRVLSTLSNEPKLLNDELSEVIKLRTALNQVGRNVNQIARKSSKDINSKELSIALKNTQFWINKLDKKLDDLISKTVDRWAFVSKKNG
uniref:Plasmid mobilization relaxosome protein MobC n=1 Tax=Aggregatibacter actinomycetemcomitans TaxID=714 RepID=S4WBA7_AGGAC|nr:hypothetical protein [Aggregatibacter actinomycetemcomitans]AGO88742.1 hypothetical protein pS23A_0009 [Aggregatibacter actinomycetemcomitans]